jgi:hypothetical protein
MNSHSTMMVLQKNFPRSDCLFDERREFAEYTMRDFFKDKKIDKRFAEPGGKKDEVTWRR